jgi:hypothetical protein
LQIQWNTNSKFKIYWTIKIIRTVAIPSFFCTQNKKFQSSKEKFNCIKDGKILDPAAGSGNFLTETYISIRRLENEVIRTLQSGQMMIGEAVNPIKVSINQFYGIEINDFTVTVAKTALWIAESQMMKRQKTLFL